MNVLHINATSHTGGAALAMQRLHQALLDQGHQSRFLVGRTKFPEEPNVNLVWDQAIGKPTILDRVQSRIGNQIERFWGLHPWANRPLLEIPSSPLVDWADIIDLRNLFSGFFNLWALPELSRKISVVWRLPDMWGLTGHCAYPYDCQRWITGCFDCPLLTKDGRKKVEPPPTRFDGTRRVWKAKQGLYQQSKLQIVVTTQWMKRNVDQGILQGAESVNVISNGVNLDLYRPIPQKEARKKIELPTEKKIVLWAAGSRGNYRKGYTLALEALNSLRQSGKDMPLLITMGGDRGWEGEEPDIPIRHLGYIRDPKKQALVYAAADVFLLTTLADAQPQTALESLACGTPVIAFPVGPMPDMIQKWEGGLLTEKISGSSLKEALEIFFANPKKHDKLRKTCRNQAEEKYNLSRQTQAYVDLYQDLLAEK